MLTEESIIAKWNADMYDQNETETADIEFLLSVIPSAPQKVLEACCGSGRILVPLAEAGYTVTGFDMDEFMLDRIVSKVKGLHNLTWHKADAVKDDWGSCFDIVILAANVLFNIVSDMDYEKAQELFIQKAADALIPGGSVYIDYQYFIHPEKIFGNPGETIIWEGTDCEGNCGKMALLDNRYDMDTGICTYIRRFELVLRNGKTVQKDVLSLKHFATLEQIHQWLSHAGFTVEQEYGDYNRNPIGESTNRAIIFARKND